MDRLSAMEIFVKVVEAGNLSRAAVNLGLANASVTTWIRNLETHLGVTLLHRSTRHMKPTEEGEAFYHHCQEILAQVEAAESAVVLGQDNLRGTLRVEMPIAIGHQMVGPSLVTFAERHPELNTVVSLSNSVGGLIHRGVDVAIRMDNVDDGDLVARWIFEDEHVVCASPEFLARQRILAHPSDITPKDCLGYTLPSYAKRQPWIFRRGGEEYQIEPASNLAFNSSDALLETACRGGGFVYVLKVLAKNYLERGQLASVLTDWQTETQTFYAVYPRTRFVSPKIRAFIDFLLADVCKSEPKATSRTVPQLVARRSA